MYSTRMSGIYKTSEYKKCLNKMHGIAVAILVIDFGDSGKGEGVHSQNGAVRARAPTSPQIRHCIMYCWFVWRIDLPLS